MSTAAWCPQSTPSACDANHAPAVPSAPATPAVPTAPAIPATHYLLPTPIDPPAARHRLPTSPLTHQLLLTACGPLSLLYLQPASWYLLPTHTHHLLLTVPATPATHYLLPMTTDTPAAHHLLLTVIASSAAHCLLPTTPAPPPRNSSLVQSQGGIIIIPPLQSCPA